MVFTLLMLPFFCALTHAQNEMAFTDEFNGDALSAARWDVFRGRPAVRDGKLTLAANANNRADIQTKGARMFLYGVMTATIDSSSWMRNGQTTDTSFGFEVFNPGDCHYGVVLVANGNLGLLRAEPDGAGRCVGDPKFQEYQPIPNWDALRARRKLFVTLVWAQTGAILSVSNGEIVSEVRSKLNSDAIPNVPMRVRLNADFNETYTIESVRAARCEPVSADEFDGNQLDPAKWELVNGGAVVSGGKLTLNGGTTGASVRTRGKFPPGGLAISIESTNWKPVTQTSGSSFGFELSDGKCCYVVVLTGNGNLGMLRSDPRSGACSGDPEFQEYRAIPDWDAIRANGKVFLLLDWSASRVVARVAGGDMGVVREVASLSDTQAVSRLAMPVRFNVGAGETVVFDYVRYARRMTPLALVSAASFDPTMLSAESIATVFGSELAADARGAGALPLPTTLAGSTIKVKDSAGVERLAPIFFMGPGQANLLTSPGLAEGDAAMSVTNQDGGVSFGSVEITRAAPGLFSANASGQGVAAAQALRVKPGGAQAYEPVARFDQSLNRFVSIPIDLDPEGDAIFLILYGTGIRFRSALAAATAKIGDMPVEVLYAGEVQGLAGLDQVNLRLPRTLKGKGEVDVALTVDGKTANIVGISVK